MTRPPAVHARFVAAFSLLAMLSFGGVALARPEKGPGEVVVTLAAGESAESVVNRYGATLTGGISETRTFKMRVSNVRSTISRMRRDPSVRNAAPNARVQRREGVSFPHDDPTYVDAGGADAYKAQVAGAGTLAATGAAQAAEIVGDRAGVIVAVLDTGVDPTHEALAGRLWTNEREASGIPGYDDDADGIVDDASGYDFVDNDANPDERGLTGRVVGHGTFISSVVALEAPSARIMPLRVLDPEGVGSAFDAAAAIRFATRHGARVISMSFGCDTTKAPKVFADAVQFAEARGVVLVAAAGNDDKAALPYPASDPSRVVSVGATDGLARAAFSNYGTDETRVSSWAPGVDLVGAMPAGADGASRYARWSGTSFATGVVAAAAATVLALDPTAAPADVRSIVSHVDGYDAVTGVDGWRVDLFDAAGRAARDDGTLRIVTSAPFDAAGRRVDGSVVLRTTASTSTTLESLSVRASGLVPGADYAVQIVALGRAVPVGRARADAAGAVEVAFTRPESGDAALGLSTATSVLVLDPSGGVVATATVAASTPGLRTYVETGLTYVGDVAPGAARPRGVARCGFAGVDAQTLEVDAEAPRRGADYDLYLDGRPVGSLSGDPEGGRSRRLSFSSAPPSDGASQPLPPSIRNVTTVGRVTVVQRGKRGDAVVYAGGLSTWAFPDR